MVSIDGSAARCGSFVDSCSVRLSDVISRGYRLEAGVYDATSISARNIIESCKYGYSTMLAKGGMIDSVFRGPRFKKCDVDGFGRDAVGFLGSAEMLDVRPVPVKFITNVQAKDLNLFANRGDILISCSGTIGNIGFVSKTLSGFALSSHMIRLTCSSYGGYVYACLKHRLVRDQLQSLVYGAVIQEIDPAHFGSCRCSGCSGGAEEEDQPHGRGGV